MMRRLAVTAALLALAAGCIPDPGPTMSPGSDCLDCHGGGGEEDAVPWTIAGTWPGEGHKVWIGEVAPGTKSFTLTTNQVGNFYTREGVRFPVRVAIDGQFMPGDVTAADASCNRCHGSGGGGGGGG
jgi:hypothetical protein